MTETKKQEHHTFQGAQSFPENVALRKKNELYDAMKRIHEFTGAYLYRAGEVWMGKYMPPRVQCGMCGNDIPIEEVEEATKYFALSNEGFGSEGWKWTCSKCK